MTMKRFFFLIQNKIIDPLENSTLPFTYFILTFLSAITLRNFFESFSQKSFNYFDFKSETLILNLLHFSASYISGAISLILLLYCALRIDILKIARVILPFFLLLLLPPVIDFLVTHGRGQDILYLGMREKANPLKLFFSFFGNDPGITLGMRIEIVIALIGIFSYLYIKRKNLLLSLLYTVLAYELIFLYCAFPFMLIFITHAHVPNYSLMMLRFFAFLIFITGLVFLYLVRPIYFLSIAKDLRWLRVSHYSLMLLLGAVWVYHDTPLSFTAILEKNPHFIGAFVFAILSIFFAALFSIIMNNQIDLDIDRISNPSRPLIVGTIPLKMYNTIGYYSLFFALIYAALSGFKTLFIISLVLATYFLYSVPPIRFKRVFVLSKLVISLNSLVMILLGFILVTDNLIHFPKVFIPIYLIGFTLAANFIDIKDYAGDKATKIKTLPTVFGLQNAKRLIGLAFLGVYLSFYFLLKNVNFLPLLFVAGLIEFSLINKKNYNERIVFLFYLMSMISFIFILFFEKNTSG